MIAGCYLLHLYCDSGLDHTWAEMSKFPHEYTAETGAECRKEAKAAGWKLNPDRTAICPKCVKKLSTKEKPDVKADTN